MKRLLSLAVSIFVLSFAASASAYTINDPVGDQIGERQFDIYGINISQTGSNLTFDIYENYPQSGLTVGAWPTFAGDLALSTTGDTLGSNFNYGVALTNHDGLTAGTIYSNAQWHISNDYDPSPGSYIYNQNKIVTLKSGDVVGTATFQWLTQKPGSPDYDVQITIPNGDLFNFKGVYYASANCANDYTVGAAPEPISTVLFITGGSVLLIRRMRKKKGGK